METEIEIFRADPRASRGITATQLAEVVDDDFDANPRGLCFGHPKNDDPAAGAIKGLRLDGDSLFARVAPSADAVDGIKSGKWLNRSAAFFSPNHEANPRPGKWTLRHVGLLGASAPGIPGMTPLGLAFAADGETLEVVGEPAEAVIYAGEPTPVRTVFDAKEPAMSATEKTPEEIDAEFKAREDALAARERAAAERIKTTFEAGNASTVDALVAAGKVLPAEADDLKAVFNAFDPEADELTFGAGDKATKATASAKLGAFLSAALGKRVPIGGRESPATEFGAGDTSRDDVGTFTAKAEQMVKDGKAASFDDAVFKLQAAAA